MGNRGSRRSGNGAGCCPRPTCSDRQSLRNRGSRRSGNGAGCCTRSTYSDRQSLRNRGSRRSSGNGACGCTALVLRGSSLPRASYETAADAPQVQLRGVQCSCKCKWADARASRPTGCHRVSVPSTQYFAPSPYSPVTGGSTPSSHHHQAQQPQGGLWRLGGGPSADPGPGRPPTPVAGAAGPRSKCRGILPLLGGRSGASRATCPRPGRRPARERSGRVWGLDL